METKKTFFVANWKMNMPLNMAQAFIQDHLSALELLAQTPSTSLIICPSFIALTDLCTKTRNTSIKIGAQNCSQYSNGAYTGEIDAQSIAQAGCSYTIVGHSERRHYFNESNAIIGEKISRLVEHNLIPIACIGETLNDYATDNTFNVLQEQLNSIILHSQQANTLLIAYEPVWAIGTSITPDKNYLEKVFFWLEQNTRKKLPVTDLYLLYGGSVHENNASSILSIQHIDGLLIGNASLNFQKFQNIVLSNRDAVSTIK